MGEGRDVSKGFLKLTLADFLVRSAYQTGKTPLLPLFTAALGAGDALLGMIVAVSTFTGMVLKPVVGLLSDRWGRRRWLIVGTIVFTLVPFAYAFVQTPVQLFWIRLVHGTATAIYGPVTLAYLAGQSRKRLAERLGWFGLAREGGYIVGPALAGVLLLVWSPQSIFALIGLISALAFVPILLLPEPEAADPATRSGIGSQLARALGTAKRSGSIWLAGGLESVNFVVLYALKAFLPLYALSVGFSVAFVGAFFAVQEATHVVLKPFTGRLGDRFGYLAVIASGMTLLGGSVLWLVRAEAVPSLLLVAALSGVAQALIFPSSLALVAHRVDGASLGVSMGMVGSMRNAGKVLGPVLGGLLIQAFEFRASFQLLGVALVVLAGLMSLRVMARRVRAARSVVARGTD